MRDDWRYGTRPSRSHPRSEAEREEEEREEAGRRSEPPPSARTSDWQARDPDAPQQVMGPGHHPGYYGRATGMGPRYGARNDFRLPYRAREHDGDIPSAWGRGRMADLEAMWDVPPRPEEEQRVSPGWGPDPRGYGRAWREPYGPDYRGRGPRNYRRSDERIREDVCDVLTEHAAIDPSEVTVQVEDGEVTLTGTIESRPMKRLAEDAICDVSGVRDVMNQLRIRRGQEREQRESGGTSAADVEDARAYGA